MKRSMYRIFVLLIFILAISLGLFGQDIAYFLHEHFPVIKLTTSIAVTTIISVNLFIIMPIGLLTFDQKNKSFAIISSAAFAFIGLPVSIWSIFVMAMWYG